MNFKKLFFTNLKYTSRIVYLFFGSVMCYWFFWACPIIEYTSRSSDPSLAQILKKYHIKIKEIKFATEENYYVYSRQYTGWKLLVAGKLSETGQSPAGIPPDELQNQPPSFPFPHLYDRIPAEIREKYNQAILYQKELPTWAVVGYPMTIQFSPDYHYYIMEINFR